MTEVISRFGERDTRDELGLGSVRDALANGLWSTARAASRFAPRASWTAGSTSCYPAAIGRRCVITHRRAPW